MLSTFESVRRWAGYALDMHPARGLRMGAIYTSERMLENSPGVPESSTTRFLSWTVALFHNSFRNLMMWPRFVTFWRQIAKWDCWTKVPRQIPADVHYLFCLLSIESTDGSGPVWEPGGIPEDPKTKLALCDRAGRERYRLGTEERRRQDHRVPLGKTARGSGDRQRLEAAVDRSGRGPAGQARRSRGRGIFTLGTESDSDSVRLRAWRAILADQMQVAQFADLEYRMTELEQDIKAEKEAQK